MKIIVYHTSYGCETGCCGHAVEFEDGSKYKFEFAHPNSSDPDEMKKFAEDMIRNQFGEEHVKDLDWENCGIIDD